jgi:TetR/AcrR family transcriptional regulator, transcriptional repressor for nem operon
VVRIREFDTDAAIEAALASFRATGYEGTSIQALVEATGVGRGSLYAAFGSKEGLYLQALDRYRENYADPLIALLGTEAPALELIREILVGLVDEIVRDDRRLACLIVSAATERIHQDSQVASRVRTTTQSLEDAFTQLLTTAQANGEIGPADDPRGLARLLVMTTHGLRVSGAINPDRGWLMSVVEEVLGRLAD